MKELVDEELLILNVTKWVIRKSSVLFNGGEKCEVMFLNIEFLVWQILSIVKLPIEIEKSFLTIILIDLKRCHLQLDNCFT